MLGNIEGKRERGQQRMRWLDSVTNSLDVKLSICSGAWWRTEGPRVLQSMGSQRVRHDLVTEQEQSYTAFSTFAGIDKKHQMCG